MWVASSRKYSVTVYLLLRNLFIFSSALELCFKRYNTFPFKSWNRRNLIFLWWAFKSEWEKVSFANIFISNGSNGKTRNYIRLFWFKCIKLKGNNRASLFESIAYFKIVLEIKLIISLPINEQYFEEFRTL